MINSKENNVKITSNKSKFELDLYHLAKSFYPTLKICISLNQTSVQNQVKTKIIVKLQDFEKQDEYENPLNTNHQNHEKQCKIIAKQCLYKTLSKISNKSLEWGILTGIRPTQLARELIENGVDKTLIKEYLIKHFYLSPNKSQ